MKNHLYSHFMRHSVNNLFLISLCFLSQWSFAQEIKIVFSEDLGGFAYLVYTDTLPEPVLRNAFDAFYGEKAIIKNKYNSFNSPVESSDSARMYMQQILNGTRNEPFSNIDFEVYIEKGPLLSFSSFLTLEGVNKISNSLTSDYPQAYPMIIDVQNMKILENPETFIKGENINELGTQLHMQFSEAQNKLYAEGFVDDCRISKISPEEWKKTDLLISNSWSLMESEDNVWHFFLACDGLHFTQNYLVLQELICLGPDPEYLVPWDTLLDWVRPEYSAFFHQTYLNCH